MSVNSCLHDVHVPNKHAENRCETSVQSLCIRIVYNTIHSIVILLQLQNLQSFYYLAQITCHTLLVTVHVITKARLAVPLNGHVSELPQFLLMCEELP